MKMLRTHHNNQVPLVDSGVVLQYFDFSVIVGVFNRNIWKILLDMGEYDKARSHCLNDPEKVDLISHRQAESLFNTGKYVPVLSTFQIIWTFCCFIFAACKCFLSAVATIMTCV